MSNCVYNKIAIEGGFKGLDIFTDKNKEAPIVFSPINDVIFAFNIFGFRNDFIKINLDSRKWKEECEATERQGE